MLDSLGTQVEFSQEIFRENNQALFSFIFLHKKEYHVTRITFLSKEDICVHLMSNVDRDIILVTEGQFLQQETILVRIL